MKNYHQQEQEKAQKDIEEFNKRWDKHLSTQTPTPLTSFKAGLYDIATPFVDAMFSGGSTYANAIAEQEHKQPFINNNISINDLTNGDVHKTNEQLKYGDIGSMQNSTNEAIRMLPTFATAILPSTVEAKAQQVGSTLLSKTANFLSNTAKESALFTAITPETYRKDDTKNIFEKGNFNKEGFGSSLISNAMMIGGMNAGLKAVGSIPKAYEVAKNIGDIAKDKTIKTAQNIKEKIKDPTNINKNIDEARIHKNNINDNINSFNETNNYKDVNLIDEKQLQKEHKNIAKKLDAGDVIELNNLVHKNNGINLNRTLLIEYPEADGSGAFVLPKDIAHQDGEAFAKYLEDVYEFTDEEARQFVENNNIIAVGKEFKNLEPTKQKAILEHELSHQINKNIHGDEFNIGKKYYNASGDLHDAYMKKDTLDSSVADILSNENKKAYYLNESEATAQIGSLIDNLNKNNNIYSGIDNFKNNELTAVNLYTKLVTDKDWKTMSKKELIDTLNKAQNKIDEIYKNNKIKHIDEQAGGSDISLRAIEPRKVEKVIEKINDIQKETDSKDFDNIKTDLEFAKKTNKEHIDTLVDMTKEIKDIEKRTSNTKDIIQKQKLQKQLINKIIAKDNYLTKLTKLFDYSDSEIIKKLNNEIDKQMKKLDNAITKNTKTKYIKTNNSKAIQRVEKVGHKPTKYQIKTVLTTRDTLKQLNNMLENKRKFIYGVLKNDKIFEEYQKDFINKNIDKINETYITEKLKSEISKKEDIQAQDIKNHTTAKKAIDKVKNEDKSVVDIGGSKDKINKQIQNKKEKKQITTTNEKIQKQEPSTNAKETTKKSKNKKEDDGSERTKETINEPKRSNISIDYIKRKIKAFGLKLKLKRKGKFFKLNINKMDSIGSNPYQKTDSIGFTADHKIYLSEFKNTLEHIGFETQMEIAFHEALHIMVKQNPFLKTWLNNIKYIPDNIKKLYVDKNIKMQKEEVFTHYASKRFLYDLLTNSNYGKFIDKDFIDFLKEDYKQYETKVLSEIYDKGVYDTLLNEITNKPSSDLYNFINVSPFDDISSIIKDIDKKIANKIDILLSNSKQMLSKNMPNFAKQLFDKTFVKEVINDFNIGQSNKKVFTNIREIFNKKHKLLTKIKNTSNTLVEALKKSSSRKKLGDKKFNEFMNHIHSLQGILLNTKQDGSMVSIKKYYETINEQLKSFNNKIINDIFTDRFFKSKNIQNEFNKIIEQSSEPMNGGKYYLKNEFQIYNWLIRHKLIDKKIDKDIVLNYINLLLDKKYIENNKLLEKDYAKHNLDGISLSMVSFVKAEEERMLGDNYIRGYNAFTPKRKIQTGIFLHKEPQAIDGWIQYKNTSIWYRIDLRNEISNNLLEYNQNDITGQFIKVENDIQAFNIIKKLKKRNIEPSLEYKNNGSIKGLRIYFDKEFDKNILNISNDYIENLSSQYTSLSLQEVNIQLAEKIYKELKDVFSNNKKDGFTELSKEEKDIFIQAGLNIKYIKKDFKNLVASQQEFLFSKENQRIFRYIEKSYKNLVKQFKSNVTVYNIKSIVNNIMVVPTMLLQYDIKINNIHKAMYRTMKDYKEFFKTMQTIKQTLIIIDKHKDKMTKEKLMQKYEHIQKTLEYLKQNNVFYALHEQGAIQTLADDYLMNVSKKKSEIASLIDLITNNKFENITEQNNKIISNILSLLSAIENKSIQAMNFADLLGRGSLYRELIAQGKNKAEASRITNEAFVDFRRTYPKFINEFDNYGLPFIGFIYRNSYMLAKTMKDKPLTSAIILASLYTIHKYSGGNNDTIDGIRTTSWEYQNSFIDNKFLGGSLIAHLLSGDIKEQMFIPNNALIAERVMSGKENPLALTGFTIYPTKEDKEEN